MTSKTSVLVSFGMFIAHLPSVASAMTFRPAVVDGRPAIVAIGQIGLDSVSAFAVVRAARGTSIYLNSPGGNVGAAVSLGSLFRSRGVTAIIAGVGEDGRSTGGACFSACVYAFVGASRRIVLPGSRVGIHRMLAGVVFSDKREMVEHRLAADALMDFATRMGVDPSMISSAESTPSDTMRVLTRDELSRWHLVNTER